MIYRSRVLSVFYPATHPPYSIPYSTPHSTHSPYPIPYSTPHSTHLPYYQLPTLFIIIIVVSRFSLLPCGVAASIHSHPATLTIVSFWEEALPSGDLACGGQDPVNLDLHSAVRRTGPVAFISLHHCPWFLMTACLGSSGCMRLLPRETWSEKVRGLVVRLCSCKM